MPRAYEAPLGGAVPPRTGRPCRRHTVEPGREPGRERARGGQPACDPGLATRRLGLHDGGVDGGSTAGRATWSTGPWARAAASSRRYALGTMTFGNETDEAGAHAQLDAFVEAGGTLVDTADVYTRRHLGGDHRALAGDRPPTSATGSCSPPRAGSRWATGPNDVGLSRRHLRDALDASLRRLRRRRRRPLPGARLGPADPARGDAGASSTTPCGPARSATSGCPTLRLAGAEGRRPRRPPRPGPPGDAAAAVQPAGPRDRVGDRARVRVERARAAALVAARRRLADRQVHAGRGARPAPPGWARTPSAASRPTTGAARRAHLGRRRRRREDRRATAA